MEKIDIERKEDTGKLELERIIACLKQNGYKFKGTREADNYYAHSNAIFEKNISFSDKDGNWINDNHIKISIEYNDRCDYKNSDEYIDKDNEFYDDEKRYNKTQSEKFIQSLIEKTYDLNSKLPN